MIANRKPRESGYLLISVIVILGALGALAVALTSSTSQDNARVAKAIQDTQLDYLVEAALDHAQWQLSQNSTCTGYTDIPATTFALGEYTVSISPTSGSPVSLGATGIESDGSSRSRTRGDIDVYTAPLTLVLQPGTNGTDSYIWDGGHDDKNFGAATFLSTNTAGKEKSALIKFDLSMLPTAADIQSADLSLWLEGADDVSDAIIDAHRLTQAWIEGNYDDEVPAPGGGATYDTFDGTTAWATSGGDYDPTPISSTIVADGTLGAIAWDVTSAVSDWHQGAYVNEGLLLRVSAGTGKKMEYSSGDHAIAAQRPKLTVTYHCVCGVDCTAGASDISRAILSVASNASLGGLEFSAIDLAEYTYATNTAIEYLIGSDVELKEPIDALHVLSNGELLLSSVGTMDFGGIDSNKEDLIAYNPVTNMASLYFDGSAEFTSGTTNIAAVYVRGDGHLLLANGDDAEIGGLKVGANDIFAFDPLTGNTSLYFDGDAAGLVAAIDAIHLLDDGRIAMSFATDAEFVGLNISPDDVVAYDSSAGSATLVFNGALFSNDENITSLHIGVRSGVLPIRPSTSLAHWKLDESSGVTATDSVGSHHGELTNGPTWTSDGKIDGGLRFDGVNDTLKVPHHDALSFTDSFSMSAWINNESASISSSYRILSKESTNENDNYWVSVQNRNLWVGIGGTFHTAPTVFSPDTWYHVAVTFDDAADSLRLYVDGLEVVAHNTSAALVPNNDTLYIGSSWDGTKLWEGVLDDVRLYAEVLSADEIAVLGTAAGGDGSSDGGGGSEPANFGNDTISAGPQNNVRRKQIATRAKLSVDAVVTEISAYVGGDYKDVRYAIYSDNGGEPDALLVESANVGTSDDTAWVSASLSPTTLLAGTYWLALSFEDRDQIYFYETDGETRYNNNRATDSGYDESWGTSSANYSRNISIYATYTPN